MILSIKKCIYFIFICITAAGHVSCTFKNNAIDEKKPDNDPVSVIFDTDIGGDYDDVGALGMLHALQDSGVARILATMSSNLYPLVVPSIDVINTWFGHENIPIGTIKSSGVSKGSGELGWSDSLVANFPHSYKSTKEAPDAVKVYREILAAQPDSSVIIVTVGYLTNIKNLLISEPDDISPLNGKEMAEKKVKLWVAMAGGFPEGREYNVFSDSTAAKFAIENWPGEILFSGFEIGMQILTGLRLIDEGPADSPVRKTYAVSIPKREYDKNGRRSWDQTAVLAAVRGIDPYFTTKRGRYIAYADGSNGWKDDPMGRHRYLVIKMDVDSLTYEIESLMMHKPKELLN